MTGWRRAVRLDVNSCRHFCGAPNSSRVRRPEPEMDCAPQMPPSRSKKRKPPYAAKESSADAEMARKERRLDDVRERPRIPFIGETKHIVCA